MVLGACAFCTYGSYGYGYDWVYGWYLFNHLGQSVLRAFQSLYYRVAPYAETAATVAEALALAATGTPSPTSILMPGGAPIGVKFGNAGDEIRSVAQAEFDRVVGHLMNQSTQIEAPKTFAGQWFRLNEGGGEWGLRMSKDSGLTLQLRNVPGVTFNKIHIAPSPTHFPDGIPR